MKIAKATMHLSVFWYFLSRIFWNMNSVVTVGVLTQGGGGSCKKKKKVLKSLFVTAYKSATKNLQLFCEKQGQ